ALSAQATVSKRKNSGSQRKDFTDFYLAFLSVPKIAPTIARRTPFQKSATFFRPRLVALLDDNVREIDALRDLNAQGFRVRARAQRPDAHVPQRAARGLRGDEIGVVTELPQAVAHGARVLRIAVGGDLEIPLRGAGRSRKRLRGSGRILRQRRDHGR